MDCPMVGMKLFSLTTSLGKNLSLALGKIMGLGVEEQEGSMRGVECRVESTGLGAEAV